VGTPWMRSGRWRRGSGPPRAGHSQPPGELRRQLLDGRRHPPAGAHQAAQTSSSTGNGEASTRSSKRASSTSRTSVVRLRRPCTGRRPAAGLCRPSRRRPGSLAPQRRHTTATVTRQVCHFLSANARVCYASPGGPGSPGGSPHDERPGTAKAPCVNCREAVEISDRYAHGDHIRCGACGTDPPRSCAETRSGW